jgi:hypothetical protein
VIRDMEITAIEHGCGDAAPFHERPKQEDLS